MGRMTRAPAHTLGFGLAALTGNGEAPAVIQLLPAGRFRAQDGRPADAPGWLLDDAAAQVLIDQMAARANPLVIDYEHQTLHAERNGQPAPAAGWFSQLEWRPGRGLFAVGVEWTARARAMIEAGEYRYISPVFTYGPDGRPRRLLSAAITNDPALDGMAAVALTHTHSEDTPVDQKTLELLGLESDAGPDEIATAVAELKARADRADEAQSALAALKADSAPLTVVEELKTELAALKAEQINQTVDTLVTDALADGRLLPSMESWARDLGQAHLAALTQYLESAAPIAALQGTQTAGSPPPTTESGLTDDELAVCKLLGQSPDEYRAFKSGSKE